MEVKIHVSEKTIDLVYQAVLAMYVEDGATPTRRAVADKVGLSSVYTHHALATLESQGKLRRSKVRRGALVPTAARIVLTEG